VKVASRQAGVLPTTILWTPVAFDSAACAGCAPFSAAITSSGTMLAPTLIRHACRFTIGFLLRGRGYVGRRVGFRRRGRRLGKEQPRDGTRGSAMVSDPAGH
jgi:hypothetical protein